GGDNASILSRWIWRLTVSAYPVTQFGNATNPSSPATAIAVAAQPASRSLRWCCESDQESHRMADAAVHFDGQATRVWRRPVIRGEWGVLWWSLKDRFFWSTSLPM